MICPMMKVLMCKKMVNNCGCEFMGVYMLKYDKLIRDKIPDIIGKTGKKCDIEVLDDERYTKYLEQKLNEELAEYQESKSAEELADLLEVIYAVAKQNGISISELESIRQKKAEERGAFDKKLLLRGVYENGSEKI